jgi:hypothetical protein
MRSLFSTKSLEIQVGIKDGAQETSGRITADDEPGSALRDWSSKYVLVLEQSRRLSTESQLIDLGVSPNQRLWLTRIAEAVRAPPKFTPTRSRPPTTMKTHMKNK